MSEALVVREAQEIVPQTPRGILTRDGLKEAAEQRKLLSAYVKDQMVLNTDFGVIPGTPKPTLLKPGAEKIVDLFRCTPKFKLMRVLEDYDKGLFAYTFRVQLYQRDAGVVLAEGYGSANSREGRYRWRKSDRKCPKCGKETILPSKFKDCAWFCFAKKGGCGAKFQAGDQAIEGQEAGKVENDDVATLANTILKMAKKRALVDGAIALARVSDLFTQDVEDTGQAEDPPSPEKQSSSSHGTVTDNGVEPEKEKPPPPDETLTSDLAASVKAPTSNGKSAGAVAHDLIVSIQKIDNPSHHKNWWPAHEKEWNTLPGPLRKAVQTTYDNWAPGK